MLYMMCVGERSSRSGSVRSYDSHLYNMLLPYKVRLLLYAVLSSGSVRSYDSSFIYKL